MKKEEAAADAVFPCVLKISLIFRRKHPIILGIVVLEGMVKVGTPICFTRENEFIDVGRIASIKDNDKPVDVAKKGQEVSIKIEGSNSEEMQKMFLGILELVMNLSVTFQGGPLIYLKPIIRTICPLRTGTW